MGMIFCLCIFSGIQVQRWNSGPPPPHRYTEEKCFHFFSLNRSFYVHSEKQQQHHTDCTAAESQVQTGWTTLFNDLLVWASFNFSCLQQLKAAFRLEAWTVFVLVCALLVLCKMFVCLVCLLMCWMLLASTARIHILQKKNSLKSRDK